MRSRLAQLHDSDAADGDVVTYDSGAGLWTPQAPSGGSGIPATLLDAKGDLIVASANDTAARLAVGSNGQFLEADSAQTLGVKWSTLTALTDPTTTKGDLITRTSSAITRRAVGSNGQVLTADSAETDGVKWATPASGTPAFVGCRLYKAATQTIADSTETSLVFDTEEYDTSGFHDNATNNTRITIPSGLGGYYRFHVEAYWNAMPTAPTYWLFKKNGTTEIKGRRRLDTTILSWMDSTVTIPLVATDYIEVRVFHIGGGDDVGTSTYETVLEAQFLGA